MPIKTMTAEATETGDLRSVRTCPACGGVTDVSRTVGRYRRRQCTECRQTFVTAEVSLIDLQQAIAGEPQILKALVRKPADL